jgi:hypothetical protein
MDFARLHVLHEAGAFFVTRAKSNMDAHRIYSAPADRSAGVISDQTIAMDGYFSNIIRRTCGASASRTLKPAKR